MSKLFVNTIAPNSGDTVTVSGSLTTTGKLTIGDATSDTVAITAEITSSLIPDLDDTFNLGSSTKQWKDLFIDGIANIDSASFDEIASALTPNVGGTHALGTMAKSWGSLHVHGLAHLHTASINVVSSSLLPDANNTYSLGSNTKRYADLFINGVIDASNIVVGALNATSSISASVISASGGIEASAFTVNKTVLANGDIATISGSNSAATLYVSQLQAQLNDGAFAEFIIQNTSIKATSHCLGAITNGFGTITGSIVTVAAVGAGTASLQIHNETGVNIANDSGFTASLLIL